ncbi:DUF3658 domain-containing protein [Phenylobacterium sp.]|uniref:DUF3658 domain-containing protein n=1 Tax=Phenylobacterium sp. TaxID=1871053 RepID=UPI00122999FE|nr:DUF3658 domain-containing protein [Phenylobacterium sp.]THD65139.1 MAG: DUF1835 domain-containing protein [Phenylobacterium sp.]
MSETPETLHVVLSISAPGLLRQALKLAGRKERVIGFSDCLACGPINPPAPAARVRWMVDQLGSLREDWAWLPRSVNAFWKSASEPGRRRVVWTSSRSSNEHSAFLAWAHRIGDQSYEVIDLADVEVEHEATDGRRWRDKALSLGMLGPELIAREALWDQAKPIDPAQRRVHGETWRGLQMENAPLRLIGPDGLVSAPITAFDQSLIGQANDQWKRVAWLIGGVLAEGDGLYFQVGDHILASRLAYLIQAGHLECRLPPPGEADQRGYRFGTSSLPVGAEVRLPQASTTRR